MKKCSKCKDKIEKFDNAFHKVCKRCNMERLERFKSPKTYKHTKKDIKSSTDVVRRIHRAVSGNPKAKLAYGGGGGSKSLGNKILDEIFYEECFNSCTEHKCEECDKPLPTKFKDDNGKILYKARYSHIIAKSVAPELRHSLININHLCMDCHQLWEFSTRSDMKIYNINKKRLPNYFFK